MCSEIIRKGKDDEIYIKSGLQHKKKKNARLQEKNARSLGPGSLEEAQTERPAQAYCMISDEKFSKSDRISKTKNFRAVYNKGRSYKRGEFILYRLTNELGNNRIGFSISSRSVRLAARRNRIRRIFREIYRRNKKAVKTGFDLVLVVRRDPGVKTAYKDFEKTFLELIKGLEISA